MQEFCNYDETIPELVYDILDYFRIGNMIKEPKNKTVLDYCTRSRFREAGSSTLINPAAVHLICENLVRKGLMKCMRVGMDMDGLDANYLFIPSNNDLFLKKNPAAIFRYNCMAYGFRFIYKAYKEYVLPIVVKKEGHISMGTCFRFANGIVTAKHCVDVEQVFIPGYSADLLNQSEVFISTNPNVDLAYIAIREPSPFLSDKAEVLDEVLVMGYPKIPMFFDFCAGERAVVSSVPTKGAIASAAEQYITKDVGPLLLVTARIRGGNSGGPIINEDGAVVGVAFSEPKSEGDYDEMGYGIAYPIDVLDNMMTNEPDTISVQFVDAIE